MEATTVRKPTQLSDTGPWQSRGLSTEGSMTTFPGK